jgi:hypothetical protein
MKPLAGTEIKDGKVHIKRGYKFIPLGKGEVAVAKIRSSSPRQSGGVSTRSYTIVVTGSYECRCKGIIGKCSDNYTVNPQTGAINILSCNPTGKGCKRGCELVVHVAEP